MVLNNSKSLTLQVFRSGSMDSDELIFGTRRVAQ
jgi:hypothetical protein